MSAIVEAADRLRTAARTGIPCAPVRDLIGSSDVDAAYAVQRRLTDTRTAAGGWVVGRKIGLTSPSVQQQLGVDRPDFGVLFADMDVTGQAVDATTLLQPKIEAEIAFRLRADLTTAEPSQDEVRRAVGSAYAALEIVDSRIAGWDISYADTVADNASSGLFVLGDELDLKLDPAAIEMTMTRNGSTVSTGSGAACLGSPLTALAWLVRTAVEYGEPLRAGQVILSGALGPMAPVSAGDRIETELFVDGDLVGSAVAIFAEEGS